MRHLLISLICIVPLLAQEDRIRDYMRWFHDQRAFPHEYIPAGARVRALAELDRMLVRQRKFGRTAESPVAAWTLIGPRPTLYPSFTGAPFTSGRVTALAVDPRNADVVYLGAAAGGVWKTFDGGKNWTPLTDDQPSIATSAIVLDPNNPDTVYVATGEPYLSSDSYYGAGILKSTDGGTTWVQTLSELAGPINSLSVGAGGARVAGLAIHPSDSRVLLANVLSVTPASSGIYRTENAGATWTKVLANLPGQDILFDPSNGNIAYASMGVTSSGGLNQSMLGVYKSTDAGRTWALANGASPDNLPDAGKGRITLAISLSNPRLLYAGIESALSGTNGQLLGLYRSTDAAATWRRVTTAPSYCASQCWYDNVVKVHPTNENVIYVAGLNMQRSTDGGATWSNIYFGPNGIAPHVDHHDLAFSKDGSRMYDANDGGVWSTERPDQTPANSFTWRNLNATLAITQFYPGMSLHPDDANFVIAGTQDNGTQKYSGDLQWEQIFGGDGGQTAVDTGFPDLLYVCTQSANCFRSSIFGNYRSYIPVTHGILPQDRKQFITPMVADPSNPQRLYLGTFRIYQTNDGGGLWTPISPDLSTSIATGQPTGFIRAMAVAPADSNIVYAASSTSRVYVTPNAGAGPDTFWVERTAGLPLRTPTAIAVDYADPQIAYVTYSGFSGFGADRVGHIFQTTDGGESWSDISADLPNIPANDLVVDPDIPGALYVATDIGVFGTSNGGKNWSLVGTGLPRVPVLGLRLHRRARILRAATHGRSMWDLQVPLADGTASAAPLIRSMNPAAADAGNPVFSPTITGVNFMPGAVARWKGQDRPTAVISPTQLRVRFNAEDTAQAGRGTVTVRTRNGVSNPMNLNIGPAPVITAVIGNAATGKEGSPLVPGSLAIVRGKNLASTTASAAPGLFPLPYTLGNVMLEIGPAVNLQYVSPTQINFQVPWELSIFKGLPVSVVVASRRSDDVTTSIAAADPGLYSADGSGTGQGAILIANTNILASRDRPAQRGEAVRIFATGLGSVSLTPSDGRPGGSNPMAISRPVTVAMGSAAAEVIFSGLDPNSAGVYRIDAIVPAGAPSGAAVPVQAALSGMKSNIVTIAIE